MEGRGGGGEGGVRKQAVGESTQHLLALTFQSQDAESPAERQKSKGRVPHLSGHSQALKGYG